MNYLWIDMEMSGLDVRQCRILEVAAIVTDGNLHPIESFHAIVYQPQDVLDSMDAWCKEHHGKSGLSAAVPKGKPELEVETNLLQLISKHWAETERPILAGNSISHDRKFIDAYMPRLAKKLHYRMLDVSSFKIVFQDRFKIHYEKKGSHRALDDIHESIAELELYLSHVRAPNRGEDSPKA